jgi:hypothetical protein
MVAERSEGQVVVVVARVVVVDKVDTREGLG